MGRSGTGRAFWAAALALAVLAQVPSCGGSSLEEGAETTGGGGTSSRGGAEPKPLGGSTSTGGGVSRGGTGAHGGAARGGTGATDAGFAGEGGQGGTSGAIGRGHVGVCDDGVPWSSNLELCAQGYVHRPQAGACAPPVRDNEYALPANAGTENLARCDAEYGADFDCSLVEDECRFDDDCGAGAYCIRTTVEREAGSRYFIYHRCVTPCRTDVDCASSEVCACDYAIQNATLLRVSFGVCTPATCRTDADCGAPAQSAFCVSPLVPLPTPYNGVGWPPELPRVRRALTSFHCQSEADECFGAGSCPWLDPTGSDCCPEPTCEYANDGFSCNAIELCDYCAPPDLEAH